MAEQLPNFFGSGQKSSYELGDVLGAGLTSPVRKGRTTIAASSFYLPTSSVPTQEKFKFAAPGPPTLPALRPVKPLSTKKIIAPSVVKFDTAPKVESFKLPAVENELCPAVEDEHCEECGRLRPDLASLSKAQETPQHPLSPSITDMGNPTMDTESLQIELVKLSKEIDEASKNYSYLESQTKEVEAQHKITKQKLEISETNHQTTRDELATVKGELKDEQKVLREATARVKELENDAETLKMKLATSETAKERLEGQLEAKNQEINDGMRDNKGISQQLTTSQEEIATLNAKIEGLDKQLEQYVICQQDLEAEKAVTASMKDQMEKMRSQPANRFNINPTAFQPKHIGGEKPIFPQIQSLADELGSDLGGSQAAGPRSSDDAGSQHGSQSNDSETEKESSSSDSSSETESEGPAPEPQVHVVYVRSPYTTSAHNPVICWFTSDYNFFILLAIYAVDAWNAITPILRRMSGSFSSTRTQNVAPADGGDGNYIPEAGHSAAPMMMNVAVTVNTPGEGRADSADTPLPDSILNLSAILGPIPPGGAREKIDSPTGSVHGDGSRNLPSSPPESLLGSFPGSHAGLDGSVPSPYVDNSPRARRKAHWKQTSINFLYHLIVYYCLYISIMTILERRTWLKANEATRSMLREYLLARSNCHNCQRSWASYFLSPRWIGLIKLSTLNIAELFRFQIKAYGLPG